MKQRGAKRGEPKKRDGSAHAGADRRLRSEKRRRDFQPLWRPAAAHTTTFPALALKSDRLLAYCLSITRRQRLKALAGGLMPRVVFEKLATLQLLDVRVPTTDGRELLLVRRTEPDRDVALLLARLKLVLPPQAPPRITAAKTN